MKLVLIPFVLLLALNSWSASAKRSPTPNFLPSGACNFRTKSFLIPTTEVRIHYFEVFNTRRGTGCLKGQTHGFWNKCDIRNNETEEGKDPSIDLLLKTRDNKTLRDAGTLSIPMTEIVQLGWITDRKGNAKSITETTRRERVDINGYILNIVAKRDIKNLLEDKIVTEVLFYQPGDKEKQIQGKLLYQARCESEFTNKNY